MKALTQKIDALDRAALRRVHKLRRPWLTAILKPLTLSGTGPSWAALAIGIFTLNLTGTHILEEPVTILNCMLGALFAWMSGAVIKKIVRRRRPFQSLPEVEPLVRVPGNDSFPSSHAASSTAFFLALCLVGHAYVPVVAVWAVLIWFSRIYLGVHYPSDVLAGIALGLVFGQIGALAHEFLGVL